MPSPLAMAWDFLVTLVAPHLSPPMIAVVILVLAGAWFARSETLARLVWRRVHFARQRRLMTMLSVGLMAVLGAASGGGIAMLSRWHYERTANLINNPGFEAKEAHWGSGYLEDGVRNLNHPGELEKLPYVVSPNPK